MFSLSTRNEFLRLRSQGVSFARIARQLGVSKPTLIKWGRQPRPETQTQLPAEHEVSVLHHELAELNKKLDAIKQELLSRTLRDIPTETLETIAGQLRKRIHALEPLPSRLDPEPSASLATEERRTHPNLTEA